MTDVLDGDAVLLPYSEPLLREHGNLRDLTGKSGETKGSEGKGSEGKGSDGKNQDKDTVDTKSSKDVLDKSGTDSQKNLIDSLQKQITDSKGSF